jgi:hypothetical protein
MFLFSFQNKNRKIKLYNCLKITRAKKWYKHIFWEDTRTIIIALFKAIIIKSVLSFETGSCCLSLLINGDASLLISERIYLVDFKEHFFETRNRISSGEAKIIAEKYESGCSLRDLAKL